MGPLSYQDSTDSFVPLETNRLIGKWVGSTVLDVLGWTEKRRRIDEHDGKDETACSRRRDGGAGRIGFRWARKRERGREDTQGQPVPIQNFRREACRRRPPSVPECQAGLQLHTFERKRVLLPGAKQKRSMEGIVRRVASLQRLGTRTDECAVRQRVVKEELGRWRELNTAEDFLSFAKEVFPLSQSLPQILHHKVSACCPLCVKSKGRLYHES